MPRGGSRPGAGRKPGGQRVEKSTITARVTPDTRETLDRLKDAGFPLGEVIDAGVEFAGRLLLEKR
jgi:phosphoglycolate phosphatase-like HAD superfamily hydrolase